MQKENGVTRGHKCVLIVENYKNISSVLWGNPMKKTVR
jgi:hypothetical protein